MKDINKTFVLNENSIEDAIRVIQQCGTGIALVVDENNRLQATITDGDIRRAILNKIPLNTPISKFLELRIAPWPQPITAPENAPREQLINIMEKETLRQLPVIDKDGRVVELILLEELIEGKHKLPLTAVVMAGGRGQRLHPLTEDTPKTMLPLQSRPIMEQTIKRLQKAGITKVNITTHYKSEIIVNHFSNGNAFGVDINYINEDQPLGTVGALSLMQAPKGPTLVINGDILTQVDFRALYDFHRLHKAIMTVGVRKYEFKIPYGVVENRDVIVKKIIEKPLQTVIVNAGIYLLEPAAYKYVPKERRFDMTDLANCLIKDNHKVICFPVQEYWLDIGHFANYEQAKLDIISGKI